MRRHDPVEFHRIRRLERLLRQLWDEILGPRPVRRKRPPLGCGRSRCLLCHREKIFQRPNARARRAAERYHQQVVELFAGPLPPDRN